ncbi:MAG: flagellar basal-body MS-ring/collar protein FliF [Halanaerobiaceae bacterium]
MAEWIRQYFDQLYSLWDNLDRKAKVIIAASLVSVLFALGFLIFSGRGSEYQPLFNQLNSRDAGEIVDVLEEEEVPHQLSNDGSTIEVPSEDVHRTRLMVAGEGLPAQGVVGFEIFDESQFGTTDFERRVNFYRAIGGELSRSIQNMGPVEYSRVQISPPEESLFSQEEKAAEASVLLQLRSGYELEKSQVKAIRNLVASSVQDLRAKDVTVVDSGGNLLSAGLDEDEDEQFSSTNQFEVQRSFEQGLKEDLETMLSRVLGPENFSIQINARLNFDEREVETESYSPEEDDEGIARSRQEKTESYRDSDAEEGGAPGTESNIPQYQEDEEQELEDGEYTKSDITTNYEIDKKIEKQAYAPGELQRLSVSVIVSDSVSGDDREVLEDSVQAAVGYSEDRGDRISVTSMEFDDSLEQEIEAARSASEEAQMRKNYLYGGLIAFVALVLAGTILFLSRRSSGEEEERGREVDMVVEGEQAEETTGPALSEEEKKRMELKEKLQKQISEQPEEVAQLVKSWLMEE